MAKKTKTPGNPTAQQNVDAAAGKFDKKSGKKPQKSNPDSDESDPKKKFIPLPPARKRLAALKRSQKLKKAFQDDYDRFYRYYQGDYSKKGRGRRCDPYTQMSVNIVYSHVEIITPAIFSGFPALKVRPKPKVGEPREQAEARARSMELTLMYWFKELGVDETLRDVFLDTFFGAAFVEVGWETEIDDREQNYETEDGAEVKGPDITTLKDRPFIVRHELRNMFLDSDARSRRDCLWYGIEEVMKWNDFLASSRFSDKAKKLVKPQLYPMTEEEKDSGDRFNDTSDKEWVQIFTIWDRECHKVYVVAEGYDFYLNGEEGEDWPYEIEYKDDPFPICVHDAKRDRNTPYTWSEFKAYEPQIIELNRLRQANQIHVKTALPKYIYTDAFGNKQDVNKLMNAKSDEAVKVENLEAIKQLPIADMPKDNHIMAVTAKEDLIEVSGLNEYQGIMANTATEASIEEGRSKMRKTMRSKLWEQFVVEIGAKLAQLCQQNMDEAIVVEIAGPNGTEWLNVSKEQIQGEFFFDIEPGVMEYKNEALRMQQFLKFSELMGNDPNVNKRALISRGAQMFDFSPEDILVPVDELPKPVPPEPTLKFKDIDPLGISDPAIMNQFLISALRQNGVDVGPMVDKMTGAEEVGQNSPMQRLLMAAKGKPMPDQSQPGAPRAPGGAPAPAPPGKNMAGNGASPNGNESMAPVVGNLNMGGNPAE